MFRIPGCSISDPVFHDLVRNNIYGGKTWLKLVPKSCVFSGYSYNELILKKLTGSLQISGSITSYFYRLSDLMQLDEANRLDAT